MLETSSSLTDLQAWEIWWFTFFVPAAVYYVWKILEMLLITRMQRYQTDSEIGLSDRQFDFRKNWCTDDTLRALHGHFVNARDTRSYAMDLSIDIRNAFKCVPRGPREHGISAIHMADPVLLSRRKGPVHVQWRPGGPRDNGNDVWGPTRLRDRAAPLEHRLQRRVPVNDAEGDNSD